jgi:hypothetical protein
MYSVALDTGSEAGMTEKAVIRTPAQQRALLTTNSLIIPDAPSPRHPQHSYPRYPGRVRHPGRDSEPGSSCSVECITSGRYSKCSGLLDTGSGAGMTTKGTR